MTTVRSGIGGSAAPQYQKRPAAPSKARRQEALAGWLMAAPAVILLLSFLIVPFLMAFGLAFTNQRLISPNPTEYVGIRNFQRLLNIRTLTLDPLLDEATGAPILDEEGNLTYPALRDIIRNNPEYPQYRGLQEWRSWNWGNQRVFLLAGDSVFMRALVNTFTFTIFVVPIQGALGLILALIVNQRTRGVNIFRTIYFMPVVVSLVVVSILWSFIYDGQNGLLNELLRLVTFGNFEPVDWLGTQATALPAIMAMSIWQGVGYHMIIWLAGLQTIPGVLYEAASVEGANQWQQFRHVTWPGLRNVAIFVLITITMAAFGLYVQPAVMTRGGPLDATTTVIMQAVEQGFGRQDISYGSAISVVFFIMVLTVALIQRYITREQE